MLLARLLENKKLLSDLIEKEKGYQNVENTSDNESNNEESSSDIENQEEEEEMASENGVEAEGTQESDNDIENDSQETESSSTIPKSPRREITSKTSFFGVTNVEQLKTKTRRRWKPIFTLLLQRRTKEMTDFWSLSFLSISFSL